MAEFRHPVTDGLHAVCGLFFFHVANCDFCLKFPVQPEAAP